MPDDVETESSLDGADSSIPATTIFASEFIEVAAQRSSSHEQVPNPDISAALSSLRKLVSLHKRQVPLSDAHRFPRQKDITAGGLAQLPMPPLSVTMAAIEKVKGLSALEDSPTRGNCPCSSRVANAVCFLDKSQSMYGYITSFTRSEDFRDRCRKVYFRTDEYTCCSYIIVNAALYYLFLEETYMSDDEEKRGAYTEYYQICQTNLETALGNLPMFLPAHCETIEALHLGVSLSTQDWLIATAASVFPRPSPPALICLTLTIGLVHHRALATVSCLADDG